MLKKTVLWLSLICLFTACSDSTTKQSEDHWFDSMPRASWSKYQLVKTNQNWFEVYQLNKNTYAIYESNQWQEAISYLLIGSQKALLVDTLQGIGDLQSVVDQLTELPIIVINTHSHFDHVSGNYQFDTIYGVNNSYAKTNAQGYKPGTNAEYVTADTFWKNVPKTFSADSYENKMYKIDHYLNDGEIIELGERPIEVAFIPGHSPDSIILVDKNHRMMMTGDSFYPAPIYIYDENSSFSDYFRSVQTMLSFKNEVDFLLPGHNETMQPVEYLERLRAATLAILAPKTSSTIEEVGVRSYPFKGFSLMVKDPLDYEE